MTATRSTSSATAERRWAGLWATRTTSSILDVILPGIDGFTLCTRLRTNGFAAPILMLTALDDVSDRVNGLDRGADDYLAKPFSMVELQARIRALGRRRVEDRAATIVVGDLRA